MANLDQFQDINQLRTIIHGLKMSGLSFVDQNSVSSIKQRIKLLPSSEMLTYISDNKNEIKKIALEVGEIINLIEIYGKRNEESKQRHLSVKGLPPRHKILEWRQAMNKNVIIRNLVNLSSTLDKNGFVKLAEKTIQCAKDVQNDRVDFNEINSLQKEITATVDNQIIKEAIGEGFLGGIKNVLRAPKELFQVGRLEGQLINVGNAINKAIQYFEAVSPKMSDPNKKTQIEQINYVLRQMSNAATNAIDELRGGSDLSEGEGEATDERTGRPTGSTTGGTSTTSPTIDFPTQNWINSLSQKDAEEIIKNFAKYASRKSQIFFGKTSAIDNATWKYMDTLRQKHPELFALIVKKLEEKIQAAAPAATPSTNPAAAAPSATPPVP